MRDLFEPRAGHEGGLAFAVRKMTIDFLSSATIDDVIQVETQMAEMRGASMTIQQAVMKGDEAVVKADVKVALIQMDFRDFGEGMGRGIVSLRGWG
ncbi:MAG: hotdog domain-containing protein [Myxococcota bacterium]